MDKDIRSELTKIAREILLLKDNVEIELLLEKVRDLYENIIVLKNLPDKQEELPEELNISEIIEKVEPIIEESIIDNFVNEKIEEESLNENTNEIPKVDTKIENKEEPKESVQKEPEKDPVTLNDLFVPTFDSIKDDMSQKAEFRDTISLEETGKMFETKKGNSQQLSLNDKLVNSSIQIGLNDRIAFVNKLFNFSQSEFNNVLSKLNTFNSKKEALNYIQYQVKPNYNWTGVEDLEERLTMIIERKFL
jgi:hypothetical protein